MNADPADYHRQLAAQIAQYVDVDDMHDGAPAAHWMNCRFLAGRLKDVFGADRITEIYARYIAEAVQRCGITEVVSLGSGYGALEIQIVSWARARGLAPFRITCLELSPALVERTRDAVRAAGLEQFVRADVADLNQPMPVAQPVAAFMAHHSLHHLVELEQLFDQVAELLHPEGAFVVIDMAGRNGHMRWPEALAVIRQLWPLLPERLKWDYSFQKFDVWYENWDCSIEGFEGIRAQDILPALMHRNFRFERFVATGGLTDVFCDRRFGRNFDLDNPLDTQFLESVQALEDRLIATGQITPVCLYTVIRSPRSQACPPQPIFAA
jgi:SAM-dependent methyltransferase